MSINCFQISAQDKETHARTGVLQTNHGPVSTPIFMPVGSQATIKALKPDDVQAIGAEIILANTYHLNLRPGTEIIKEHGGLHHFMQWDQPILTDSGGFQVFSLNDLTKIKENGVEFRSHIDGSRLFLGPEEAMQIQADLGSDIAMCFDQCISYPAPTADVKQAVERTIKWAKQCLDFERPKGQLLFGIGQGGMDHDLRQDCLQKLVDLDFDGYAIGGLSVGEPDILMYEVIENITPGMPLHKARYLMGVGTPLNLLECIARGIDMFDCVLPTRNARNGGVFTHWGPLNIRNAQFKHDLEPLEDQCECYTCCNFTKSYLRHLFQAEEMLGPILLTIHNLSFYIHLMKQARTAICDGYFKRFLEEFKEKYQQFRFRTDN